MIILKMKLPMDLERHLTKWLIFYGVPKTIGRIGVSSMTHSCKQELRRIPNIARVSKLKRNTQSNLPKPNQKCFMILRNPI